MQIGYHYNIALGIYGGRLYATEYSSYAALANWENNLSTATHLTKLLIVKPNPG